MNNKLSGVFVLVVSALVALIGLFMAAKAEDAVFAFHGWVLVVFGVVMCFGVASRLAND